MTKQNIERLISVTRLLQAIQLDMDVSCHHCETCGLTVRHNMEEHQISAMIEGMRGKVNRWIKAAQSRE